VSRKASKPIATISSSPVGSAPSNSVFNVHHSSSSLRYGGTVITRNRLMLVVIVRARTRLPMFFAYTLPTIFIKVTQERKKKTNDDIMQGLVKEHDAELILPTRP
jgi:hypothetical protein